MKEKSHFLISYEYEEHLGLLSNEELGVLIRAIFVYEKTGEIRELSGMAKMAFSFIKKDLDELRVKYEEKIKVQQINGSKGGRPKKETQDNPTEKKETQKTHGFLEKPKKPERDIIINTINNTNDTNSYSDDTNSYSDNTEDLSNLKDLKDSSSPDSAAGEAGGGENQRQSEHEKIEPPQNEPDIKSKGRHPKHYEHDSKYYKAAVWLRDKFAATSKNKIRAPTEANLQSCADTFRLMETSDGLSWKDIKAVLAWATDNEFWRKNVQSASSFRKHYNRLVADMESPTSTRASPAKTAAVNREEAYKKFLEGG